jgi:short chain dehydrogenase
MTSMISLNVTALTRLTYAIAPRFIARGAGTIINIASVVAINPEPLNGVCGTKAFVLALSQNCLNLETGKTASGQLPTGAGIEAFQPDKLGNGAIVHHPLGGGKRKLSRKP